MDNRFIHRNASDSRWFSVRTSNCLCAEGIVTYHIINKERRFTLQLNVLKEAYISGYLRSVPNLGSRSYSEIQEFLLMEGLITYGEVVRWKKMGSPHNKPTIVYVWENRDSSLKGYDRDFIALNEKDHANNLTRYPAEIDVEQWHVDPDQDAFQTESRYLGEFVPRKRSKRNS